MVSNFPSPIATHEGTHPTESLAERALDRIKQALCGMHGHDSLLQFEHDRMFLKCVSCGHESPGWELNETPPTVVAQVENRVRQPLIRPQLVDVRRIA